MPDATPRPVPPARIAGPLRTWYDLHEALGHEARALADLAPSVTADTVAAYDARLALFRTELRNHSEVEDVIMFPALLAAGGRVPEAFFADHRTEQLAVYALSCAVLRARAHGDAAAFAALAEPAVALRDSLVGHLDAEDADILSQVSDLFDDTAQATLLQTIITSMPADPHLQPWIAAALSPDHLEARLRNLAASLSHDALVGVLTQIYTGVDSATWDVVATRTPELAALVAT
ncbi:MAG: hemerythrin domain-containing protein [Actinomycetota bacterium]